MQILKLGKFLGVKKDKSQNKNTYLIHLKHFYMLKQQKFEEEERQLEAIREKIRLPTKEPSVADFS